MVIFYFKSHLIELVPRSNEIVCNSDETVFRYMRSIFLSRLNELVSRSYEIVSRGNDGNDLLTRSNEIVFANIINGDWMADISLVILFKRHTFSFERVY